MCYNPQSNTLQWQMIIIAKGFVPASSKAQCIFCLGGCGWEVASSFWKKKKGFPFKSYSQCQRFLKNVTLIFDLDIGKWPWPWHHRKCLTWRITHAKYESSMKYTSHAKVMADVKVLLWKNLTFIFDLDWWPLPWYHRKELPQGMHTRNMKPYQLPFKSYESPIRYHLKVIAILLLFFFCKKMKCYLDIWPWPTQMRLTKESV